MVMAIITLLVNILKQASRLNRSPTVYISIFVPVEPPEYDQKEVVASTHSTATA